jgi:glycine betaine/proline transport system substrate-binding protein
MAYDCGKPFGWIKKVGWKGGEEIWPCAYEAVRNMRIDNDAMGQLIIEIDLEGKSVEDAVEGWIQANEGTWREWGACAQ